MWRSTDREIQFTPGQAELKNLNDISKTNAGDFAINPVICQAKHETTATNWLHKKCKKQSFRFRKLRTFESYTSCGMISNNLKRTLSGVARWVKNVADYTA